MRTFKEFLKVLLSMHPKTVYLILLRNSQNLFHGYFLII